MLDLGLRRAVGDYLRMRAIRRHHSRIGWRVAGRYTAYLERCRREARVQTDPSPDVAAAAEEFARDGVTALWSPETQTLAESMLGRIRKMERNGPDPWQVGSLGYNGRLYQDFPEVEALFRGLLGGFLIAAFGTPFKVFYGVLYKSERLNDTPVGSQLWHSDSGPGICVNVMFYLNDTDPAPGSGAIEVLPWDAALSIFVRERKVVRRRVELARREQGELTRMQLRAIECEFNRELIEKEFADRVVQPSGKAGLIVPFMNNSIHMGGYPAAGRVRYACVFHCYPSHKPTPFERYRDRGIAKTESYPKDPAVDF